MRGWAAAAVSRSGLRAQISNLAGYADTAVNLNTRISVANLSLQRLIAIGTR